MFETLILVAVLSAPCDGDACRLPVLGAPVRVTARVIEAQPARKVLRGVARVANRARPIPLLRGIVERRPVRRLLFPRCR